MPWPMFCRETLPLLKRDYPLCADGAAHLLQRHGDQALVVASAIAQVARGFERLHPDEPDLVGEAAYQRDQEMALSAEDRLLRRTRVGMWRPELLRSAGGSPARE